MSPEQKKYLGNTTLVKFLWLLKKVNKWLNGTTEVAGCIIMLNKKTHRLTSRFYSFVVFIITLLQTILIQTSQLVDFKELKRLKHCWQVVRLV